MHHRDDVSLQQLPCDDVSFARFRSIRKQHLELSTTQSTDFSLYNASIVKKHLQASHTGK